MDLSADCRCGPVYTKVSGCGSADGVLLPTEKASALCAETRAGGKRGTLAFSYHIAHVVCKCSSQALVFKYFSSFGNVVFSSSVFFSLQDVSELRNELQRKELLVQKHLTKLHHWQQVLEDVSVQHRKPTDLPPPGPLAFLEQASANLPPAPLKPN